MIRGNAEAGHQHLFIGPWDHEGTADLCHHVGLLPVAEGTAAMRWDSFCAFFDCYLMGLDNGFGDGGAVRYYAMGADAWRSSADWPPAGTKPTAIYLRSGGTANTLLGDGRLAYERPGENEPQDSFTYDPADPVADTLAIDCWSLAGQMGDRRTVQERSDVLVYSTAPLSSALELTGPITAQIFFASSAPDTDVTVALSDVAPDGGATLIQDGILRARYRDGSANATPLEPGRVYELTIDLWSTSYLVKSGHGLRVEISSSCFNRYDRNLNTGEPLGHGAAPIKARQTVFHDAARPSHIMLPIH